MINVLILSYAAFSLLLGGIVATIEMGRKPSALDRADRRGKFASPRLRLDEGILFGFFVMLLWPYLLVTLLVDVVSPEKPGRKQR